MKKLIVTGATGFVGGNIICQAADEWEVHALARTASDFSRDGLQWHLFDLTDTEKLREVFDAVKPQAVIHSAAMADIDYCEKNKDVAELINVGVTREIARLCSACGAKLVHCSTDTVFDGVRGWYTEDDPPSPVNYYGETKVKAEQTVADEAANHVIARLSLVLGLPAVASGNSFMARMLTQFESAKTSGFPDNEIRTPVDVITLIRALLELAANDFTGIIHLSCNNAFSRYEIALRIAKKMGFKKEFVEIKNADASSNRAPRPPDLSLVNSRARSVLKTPMLSLDEGIALVLAEKKGI